MPRIVFRRYFETDMLEVNIYTCLIGHRSLVIM